MPGTTESLDKNNLPKLVSIDRDAKKQTECQSFPIRVLTEMSLSLSQGNDSD